MFLIDTGCEPSSSLVCIDAGHEASSTVNLINGEDEPLSFSIVDSSCQAAGYAVRVVVEPMQGVVPPKSRWIFRIVILWKYLCLGVLLVQQVGNMGSYCILYVRCVAHRGEWLLETCFI